MAAGTIALTNNSATVNGNGTSFTSELKAGDFVYVNVGGAPYTLVAANVTSDTQLTLAVAFDGPTTSGLAWNAVPASLRVAITQKILNDFASVARGRILDFQNWQKIYSDEQSVDVIRPDRTTFTGPSWGYMANQYAGKADKSALEDKADKSALEDYAKKGANNDIKSISGLTTALSIEQGGTGAKSKENARKSLGLGTAAVKDTGTTGSSIPTLDASNTWTGKQQSYADISTAVSVVEGTAKSSPTLGCNLVGGYSGSFVMYVDYVPGVGPRGNLSIDNFGYTAFWQFNVNGSAFAVNGSWNNGSDERVKKDIIKIDDPLTKMRQIKGVTWRRIDSGNFGIGFIAQDVEKVWPEAVSNTGYDLPLPDGSFVKNMKALNAGDIAAGLHHEAILALMEKIEQRDAVIEELQKRVKAIDGLDA